MKKMKAVVVGIGNRGSVYAEYANQEPNELEIIALVDTSDFKLAQGSERFNVPKERCFKSIKEFVLAHLECDFVINATMDQIHLETSLELLNAGYNLLLEKPIVENEKKLKKIVLTARKNNCKICVCHVLRYTPFYTKIKGLIDSGVIGAITAMQFNEHVWIVHFINSYVRGKWRNEKECGSPFLLAKSCHDMDLLCWLNNSTRPIRVTSLGSRNEYIPSNAPKGSTQYCYECPVKEKCIYNAKHMEAEIDFFPLYTWRHMDKPWKEITMEEKLEYLKHDTMGECVYKTDMDIVDRQTVSIEFENGSIASFNLVGGTPTISRGVDIIGTKGEIIGQLSENKIILRTINKETCRADEEVIDCTVKHSDGRENVDSHAGGDYGIMQNVCAFFRGDKVSSSLTKIEDSINSHLVCYAAEKSRKERKVVEIKQF